MAAVALSRRLFVLGAPQRACPLGLVALDQRGEGPLGRNGLGSRRYLATSRVTRGPDAVPPTEPINELISELQTLPTFSPEILSGVARLGELRELGLGSYITPVGLIQNLTEFLSASTGLSWAGGIALTTFVLRVTLLPVIIKSLRNNVKLTNIQSEMKMHTDRLKVCSNAGDKEGAAIATERLQNLFKDNDCHPLRSFLPTLFQMPIFVSFFLGLRKMAELPVESLKFGGHFWFTDLTVADPYYALPLIASCTMCAVLEFGSEGMKQTQPQLKMMFRALPFVLLPVSASFPAGIFVYWITANIFSLSQLIILKSPALRKALDIPEAKEVVATPATNQSFTDMTKNAFEGYMESANRKAKEKESAMRAEALSKMKIPRRPPPSGKQ